MVLYPLLEPKCCWLQQCFSLQYLDQQLFFIRPLVSSCSSSVFIQQSFVSAVVITVVWIEQLLESAVFWEKHVVRTVYCVDQLLACFGFSIICSSPGQQTQLRKTLMVLYHLLEPKCCWLQQTF